MNIKVNGETHRVPEGATLLELLAELGLDPKVVAAQVNDNIIPRDAHGETFLHEGDAVELIRFVGGG